MTHEELVRAEFNKAIGRAEGTATLVVQLLERRFGRLPEFVRERVRQFGILDLRDIAGRLLTAKNLHEAMDIEAFRPRLSPLKVEE